MRYSHGDVATSEKIALKSYRRFKSQSGMVGTTLWVWEHVMASVRSENQQ
jgi:hypothetical protein